ncbi:hypothetical protein [Streptomyces sp. DH24]|uniref:hypothetical protein n=1 Tax=Streptomyces sp. DH24 TaxID=3040123 RepID=UPI0024420DBB|nr:hypothetical protein [Streptomyces sp. DH24]MDG9716821.1 hypothetical protein [Streptomyces sp. DH24]
MTAEHDFPGGPDPLMSVIADEPLPEAARQDAGFLAEHRAAAADVALLREQLGLIGHALAQAPGEAGTEAATAPVRPTAPTGAAGAAGTCGTTGTAGTHGPAGPAGTAGTTGPARTTGTTGTTGPARTTGPTGPAGSSPLSRPSRTRRRPFAVALGGLAVACAATLVSGLAWLLTQAGGSADSTGADKSAAQADSEAAPGILFGSPRYLACARLVAEGTVTDVERLPGAGRTRITLDVTRTYKPDRPAKGGDPLVFLVEAGGVPGTLRVGDRAVVGFSRSGDVPDALITGEREIAAERARIVRSLPESRTLTCPGG